MIVQLEEDIPQDIEHSWHSFLSRSTLTCTLQLLLLCVFVLIGTCRKLFGQLSSPNQFNKNRNSPTHRTFGWSLSDITCHTTSADKRNEKKVVCVRKNFVRPLTARETTQPTELTKLNPNLHARDWFTFLSRRQKPTNKRTNSLTHKHANTSSIKAESRRQPSSANKEERSTQFFFISTHKYRQTNARYGEKPTLWETTTQYREILLLFRTYTHIS